MKIDVHHYLHFPSDVTQKLDQILDLLRAVQRKEETMSVQLDTLTTQVKANTDVEASAVILLKGLADQIAAAKTDPVALQTLSDSLKSSADQLAAAVIENTPQA
jgi:cell division septum initiation protein DivIVA